MHTTLDDKHAGKQRSLVARLARVRRRLLALGTMTALIWGLIAATATLAAAVWLDLLWELAPQMRIVSLVVAAAVGVLLIVVYLWSLVRIAGNGAMARRLDVAGRTGGQIVTGLELSSGLSHGESFGDLPLSSALAAISVRRAADVADTVPARDAVSSRGLRRSLFGIAIAGLVIGVIALAFPQAASTQWRRFANPMNDVPPYSRLTFDVQPAGKRVVYGQGLDIFATVSGAGSQTLDRVELVIVPETAGVNQNDTKPADAKAAAADETEVLPMFNETGGRWRAVLTRVTQPAQYYVRSHGARSPHFKLDVLTVPRIEKVRVKITPPEYAHSAAYEGALPKDGIAGLAGTRVDFVVASNRPLSSGRVKFVSTDKQQADKQPEVDKKTAAGKTANSSGRTRTFALTPTAAGASEVAGSMKLSSSGTFQLEIEDVEGQVSTDPFGGNVVLLPDQRPFVRLLRPRPTSLATPNSVIPVEVAAEDDCGLSKLLIFRSLNDSRDLALDVPLRTPPDKSVRQTTELPLSQYGLTPGDVIKVFARVEDNDPAGAKGAETPVATINIISQEDFERMVRRREGLNALTSKYQQAARQAEQLASQMSRLRKKLAKQDPKSKVAEEIQQEMEQLEQKLAEAAKALEKASQHQLPYDIDNNLGRHLKTLSRRMQDQAEKLRQLRRLNKLTNAELELALSPLEDEFRADQKDFDEQVSELMEELAKAFPLVADESRFEALVRRQEDLANRMASLKGHDNEDNPAMKARMRDLEEEQQAVRTELEKLLDEVVDHVAQLPEGEQFDKLRDSATKFVKAVRDSGASEAMTEAESALTEFAGTRAHEQAQKAADLLKALLDEAQQVGAAGRSSLVFRPGRGQALGNTVDQLLGEMGLQPGNGQGEGGYSSRSNSLQNVGLYGELPGDAGDGQQPDQPPTGAGEASDAAHRPGGVNPDRDSAGAPGADAASSSGAASNTVPPKYKRRVGQYFQRVNEESGGR
ncbi:MAG: hypothetical protein K8T25_12250 [Planctomycetia bacterium]|nr:hypothetical protein [Planctomycetia bacterium]